ncbi:hypothetical protein ACFWIW_33370 [Amycolatopsis sp. NPDC058340]|uniref:hypothetical protein n=1 Tax=Amycolatopsis sp. NPDC058340 TaxID=3346453 RepID=UPI00365D236E
MTTIAEAAQVCDNELIHELMELELDPDQFVIFGSAPLLAHGLRAIVHDLDIVARGAVMDFARKTGTLGVGRYSGDPVWHLNNGRLQFSAGWITNHWDANQLIDNAEVIGSLRFARLSDVLRYKQELLRKKDLTDITRIQSYLRQ